MNIRFALVLTLGLLGAISLGNLIGQEEFLIPILVGIIGLIVAGFKLVIPRVNPAATCLIFLIAGYLIANRGFASLGFGVVYVGEVCMLMGGLLLLLSRGTLMFDSLKGFLGRTVLVLLAMGFLRLSYDLILGAADPIDCIRDSAVSYYACFFPLGYAIAVLPASHSFMLRMTRWICLISIIIGSIYIFKPGLFDFLSYKGKPFILFKGDLLGMCFGIGVVVFGIAAIAESRSMVWRGIFGMFSLLGGVACAIVQSRAAYVGVGAGFLVVFITVRFWTAIFRLVPGMVLFFVVGTVSLISIMMVPSAKTQIEEISDAVIGEIETMISPFDDRSRNVAMENSRQNNRFRTAWWGAVIEEVYERNLLFGVGFGEPLALKRFVATYELPIGIEDDESVVRSPHSIAFTYFGRFGLVGAIWFILFLAAFLSLTSKSIKRTRAGELKISALTWLSASWVILLCAMFGVVIEGPMGGIPFWIFTGLAYGQLVSSQTSSIKQVSGPTLAVGVQPQISSVHP